MFFYPQKKLTTTIIIRKTVWRRCWDEQKLSRMSPKRRRTLEARSKLEKKERLTQSRRKKYIIKKQKRKHFLASSHTTCIIHYYCIETKLFFRSPRSIDRLCMTTSTYFTQNVLLETRALTNLYKKRTNSVNLCLFSICIRIYTCSRIERRKIYIDFCHGTQNLRTRLVYAVYREVAAFYLLYLRYTVYSTLAFWRAFARL